MTPPHRRTHVVQPGKRHVYKCCARGPSSAKIRTYVRWMRGSMMRSGAGLLEPQATLPGGSESSSPGGQGGRAPGSGTRSPAADPNVDGWSRRDLVDPAPSADEVL